MKKLYFLVKHWVLEGWEWMEDGYMQVMYIAAIISELLILHKIESRNVMLYTISFVIHLALLCFFGYKKCRLERKLRKKIYQWIFFFTCVCIAIATCIFTKSCKALIVLVVPFVIAGINFILLEKLFEIAEQKDSKIFNWIDKQFLENSNWYILMMIIMPIVIVGIPLIFLDWNVYVRVAIFIVYLFSIPLISRCAEEGISIFYMLEND